VLTAGRRHWRRLGRGQAGGSLAADTGGFAPGSRRMLISAETSRCHGNDLPDLAAAAAAAAAAADEAGALMKTTTTGCWC